MNFAELRREIRARRRAIVGAQREALSAAATVQALSCPALRRAERVAVFRSLPEEIDTEALLATLHNQGKRLYLPYVTGRGEALAWLPYQPGEALQPDRGRVLAPRWQPEALLPAADLPARPLPLPALAKWWGQLAQAARSAEHPLNAGLTLEYLASSARQALNSAKATN